ncbi:hypothetical protein BD779DRAFT_1799167 [Infundibulicybe gibba]|nr:hypothetical protein BD779DRAFT_1799167 [Infundibulicybe gibba]
MSGAPQILNIHTPSSSFAIVHACTNPGIPHIAFRQAEQKSHTEYYGERVGPGWLKYEFNETVWNLDDESDYAIFVWRQQQQPHTPHDHEAASTSSTTSAAATVQTPTLYLHSPSHPLPSPPAYQNPSYYLFQPSRIVKPRSRTASPRPRSSKSHKTTASKRAAATPSPNDGVPAFKREFEKFHGENGVRTVIGSIGPVHNVRMLLKSGYRHVYVSRKFAMNHGFIPSDAAPGHYGYGGLVNIGKWPITLTPSASFDAHPPSGKPPLKRATPLLFSVYLSEEPHFDVVLGRSFFERRQIRTSAMDPTDVVCLDTGEKVECEVVILKDGRGEIVTVT